MQPAGFDKEQRVSFLKTAIAELAQASSNRLSTENVLNSYRTELANLLKPHEMPVPTPPAEDTQKKGTKAVFSNWYEENNILFLLYLGAFLIVVSAGIFVAFNWEQISGIMKTAALLITTLTFLLAGIGLYKNSTSLKIAGVTFAAIGAIIFPINGIAYYKFISSNDFSVVWLVTSALSIILYYILGKTFEKTLYSYLTSLTLLSFILSFVRTLNIDYFYYTYSGILASFVVFFYSLGETNKDSKKAYQLTSNVFLPLTLLIGTVAAASNGDIYSQTYATTIALGAVYYFLVYKSHKAHEYFAIGLALAYFVIFIEGNIYANAQTALYIVFMTTLIFSHFEELFEEKMRLQSVTANLAITVPALLYAWLSDVAGPNKSIVLASYALILALRGFYTYTSVNIKESLVYGQFMIFLATAFMTDACVVQDKAYVFALAISIVALINYWIYREKKQEDVFLITSLIFSAISFALVLSNNEYSLLLSLIFALLYFIIAKEKREDIFEYVSYGLVYVAVAKLLLIFDVNGHLVTLLPLTVLSTLVTEKATILKKRYLTYTAGLLWAITYANFLDYIGINERQIFFIPVGLALISGSIIERKGNYKYYEMLEIPGIVLLFITLLPETGNGINGAWYALLMGIEGLLFAFVGISTNYKRFMRTGAVFVAVALLTQTWEFLTSLPRWMITSATGAILLGIALYLLYKKSKIPEE